MSHEAPARADERRPDERALLAAVEDALAADFSSDQLRADGKSSLVLLHAAERHLCLQAGAKRARPRLCFLFGRMAEADAASLVDAAVAVELIHSASLLHDDVVDEGAMR